MRTTGSDQSKRIEVSQREASRGKKMNGCKVWEILRGQFIIPLGHWDKNSNGAQKIKQI